MRSGAQCSDSNHACCLKCKIRSVDDSFVCARASPGSKCQFDSKCDGLKADCPAIKYAPDGASCELEGGRCASGLCTSRDMQCAAVGRRLGIRRACPSTPSTCKLTCDSGKGNCVLLDATFMDGTPCGKKGICTGGTCSEASVSAFMTENAPMVMITGGLIGALLFIMLLRAVLSLRRRS